MGEEDFEKKHDEPAMTSVDSAVDALVEPVVVDDVHSSNPNEEVVVATNAPITAGVETPHVVKSDKSMCLDRLALIFKHMLVTCMIIVLSCGLLAILIPLVGSLILVFVYLVCFLICAAGVVVTFGLILLEENSFVARIWEFLSNLGDVGGMATFANFCYSLVPYFCVAGLVACVLSLVMSILSKQKRLGGRYVLIGIAVVVLTISLIVFYAMGGVLWQYLD